MKLAHYPQGRPLTPGRAAPTLRASGNVAQATADPCKVSPTLSARTIAATAVDLPSTFPGDSADRLIYATAVENGWRLITKDRRLRAHRHPQPVTLW